MKYTLKEIQFLNDNYSKLGCKVCADKLNRSYGGISWKARGLNLKVSKKTILKNHKRIWEERIIKYKVNQNNFINCSTPEVAYILGLLWADGHIRQIGYTNEIQLENIKKDTDIFYPIFLKTGNWRILFRQRENRQEQGLIRTSNKLLASFLIENNYGPHNIKSADKILSLIPDNLHQYWFRGLIDGDGCWYLNIKNSCRQFSLAGSYEQNWLYFENLLSKLNIKFSIKRIKNKRNSSSYIRSFGRKNLIKLGNYIYQNYEQDKIGLDRKYNKFIEIKNS